MTAVRHHRTRARLLDSRCSLRSARARRAYSNAKVELGRRRACFFVIRMSRPQLLSPQQEPRSRSGIGCHWSTTTASLPWQIRNCPRGPGVPDLPTPNPRPLRYRAGCWACGLRDERQPGRARTSLLVSGSSSTLAPPNTGQARLLHRNGSRTLIRRQADSARRGCFRPNPAASERHFEPGDTPPQRAKPSAVTVGLMLAGRTKLDRRQAVGDVTGVRPVFAQARKNR